MDLQIFYFTLFRSNCSGFVHCSLFNWLRCLFDIALSFFKHFLISVPIKCSRFILYFPCPSFEHIPWWLRVKSLPAMWETQMWSLGWEDPLEKGMATLSSILAWKFSRTEEPGGLQSMESQKVRHDWTTNTQKPWDMSLQGVLVPFIKNDILLKQLLLLEDRIQVCLLIQRYN